VANTNHKNVTLAYVSNCPKYQHYRNYHSDVNVKTVSEVQDWAKSRTFSAACYSCI